MAEPPCFHHRVPEPGQVRSSTCVWMGTCGGQGLWKVVLLVLPWSELQLLSPIQPSLCPKTSGESHPPWIYSAPSVPEQCQCKINNRSGLVCIHLLHLQLSKIWLVVAGTLMVTQGNPEDRSGLGLSCLGSQGQRGKTTSGPTASWAGRDGTPAVSSFPGTSGCHSQGNTHCPQNGCPFLPDLNVGKKILSWQTK